MHSGGGRKAVDVARGGHNSSCFLVALAGATKGWKLAANKLLSSWNPRGGGGTPCM